MKENKTQKATVNTKATTVSKEEKVMKKNEVAITKKAEVKTVKKETVNQEKTNAFLTIEQVTDLYKELGIKCANPTAKGNYRIMGSKSSLNVKPKKGYYIYTADSDYEALTKAGLKFEDLTIEQGTNSQDKTRPNTVICTTLATLKAVLAVYAKNPMNATA